MRPSTACLGLALLTLGCAGGQPSEEDHAACVQAGHAPGSGSYEACLEERLAMRFARPAGSTVDDMRTRVGPRR